MIVTDNGFFTIAGWEEYQNIDGMEKIREQNRERKRLQRERRKQSLLEVSRDGHGTVTECHAIEVDVEVEKEKELEKDFSTTTTTGEPPFLTEVYRYFKEWLDEGAAKEAEKFHAYNAKRGWDCLPNWEATADLWIARIGEDRSEGRSRR